MATRNFPKDSLAAALVIAQQVADENAGRPMNRLLVADSLGVSPGSSNFRYLLSSSRSYGLTEGTEKAHEISLTPLGREITSSEGGRRMKALRQAALTPPAFDKFFKSFDGNKLPSNDMMAKLLVADFGVPEEWSTECADLIRTNGSFVGIIREISGSPHVMLDSFAAEVTEPSATSPADEVEDEASDLPADEALAAVNEPPPPASTSERTSREPRAIFVGHGKKKGPLEKLEKLLSQFQIPFKVAIGEPNLGRPIPTKVKEIMDECGSAILIFTCDELFMDEDGNKVWRPSENVVHELGAASFAYGDRIVIFKEAGLKLASNFSSIGYIEFDELGIEAKTAELLQELIGFGLVKITPAS